MNGTDSFEGTAAAISPVRWLPRALWWKAWADARQLLISLSAVMFLFQVIYVWLTSQIELGALGVFLQSLPKSFEKMIGLPLAVIATPTGRLAMAYLHPVTTLVATSWAITRGSDCVSGEIGRGTMEMVLAQPVRRWSIIATHGLMTSLGAASLAAATWLGIWVGVTVVGYQKIIQAGHYVPAALNLFGFIFFLAAVSTFVSACDSDRRRTVGILCGFYLLELLTQLIGRVVPGLWWFEYGSFFTAFRPDLLSVHPETAWHDLLKCNAALIGAGLLAYGAAISVFARRDLPAPL